MAVRFFDKVYVRGASTAFTTLAKTALSSWTLIPSGIKVSGDLIVKTEADVSTTMGDGSDYVGSEAGSIELQLMGFSPAQITTIRTNLLNVPVDILVYDSNVNTSGYVLFGVILYPSPELASGKEPVIKLTGKKRYPSDVTPAFTPVTLT